MVRILAAVAAAVIVSCAQADVYLHTIRGSNNRLDEANRDRNNANRVFDSQNNNRGGNNVGSLYFYEGEDIAMQWTNQHGCGNSINGCEMVVQYMCSENLRDGVTTRTIPDQPTNCLNNDCNTDVRYGMHESYDYYMNCKYRFRNKGLFTADRNLNGNTARYTRQNNNGQRRGYECPEERDHYPYWHPTPWIDLSVHTNNPERCQFYKENSENVKGRHFCALPDLYYHHMIRRGGNGRNGFIPNTEATCLAQNRPGTGMTNFLRENKLAQHAELKKGAQEELQQCQNFLADFNLERAAAGEPTLADFCADKTISPAELETMCPQCNAGFMPHPRPPSVQSEEPCFVCVPEECGNGTAYSARPTGENTDCPAGTKPDLLNPDFCVTDACFNRTNTHEEQLERDTCRLRAVSDRHLVANCEDNAQRACVERDIMNSDCFASDIPQAEWRLSPSHKEADPTIQDLECVENSWSRPNHLGNGVSPMGHNNGWNFSMPSVPEGVQCTVRLRYNITTTDYPGLDPHNPAEVNSALNKRNGNNPAKVNIGAYHNIGMMDSNEPWLNARGYLFKQNPTVQIFDDMVYQHMPCPDGLEIPGDVTRCYRNPNKDSTRRANADNNDNNRQNYYCPVGSKMDAAKNCIRGGATVAPAANQDTDFTLQLAINTNQFGRTFQDRTHTIYGKKRDSSTKACSTIHNLHVIGKRGNIVQTYPGTEYDFSPNTLHAAVGDCIHFHWTGSNTNPNNNDGQGKQGTDRSNIAVQEYVRGEGGRGVYKFGGKGAQGTTWTTANMEPGYEGYVPELVPTMGDLPCPEGTVPHPHQFKQCASTSCASPNPNGVGMATWIERDAFITVNDRGETLKEWKPCPTGFRVDPAHDASCVSSTCPPYKRRPMNSDSWSGAVTTLMSQVGVPDELKEGGWGTSHPEHLDNVTFLGMNRTQLTTLSMLDSVQLGGEMSELDDAGTYFDMPVFKVTRKGTYNYLCTRNNNFSNRSQKGKIVVSDAPEKGKLIGTQGGVVGITVEEVFNGVPANDEQIIENSDFVIAIDPLSLPALTNVQGKVFTDAAGSDDAASDTFWLGPADMTARPVFPTLSFVPAAGSRRRSTLVNLTGSIAIGGPREVGYIIRADNLNNVTCPDPKVQFKTDITDPATDVIVEEELSVNNEIVGVWRKMDQAQMLAFEKGEMWVSLWCGGEEFTNQAKTDPASGHAINVSMPVSITVEKGSVYFWPDTPSGKKCALQGGDVTGCNSIRSKVENVWFDNGMVTFQVGNSVTQPAGGFYQVSGGSNLPIVVGVTISCLLISLIAIGAAVYFRKHPDKWGEFKDYGPKKVKSVQRSFATHV